MAPRYPRGRGPHLAVNSTLARALSMLARGSSSPVRVLDGFVDSLLQTFENCRPGLSDQLLGAEGEAPEAFFRGLYEKETPRKEAEALGKLGGDAYVKMQVAKQFAQKKILIVPASNVSTMNVNDMVKTLLGRASAPPAVEPAPAPETKR